MAVGGATGQDSDLRKTTTMIPFFVGGAVAFGGGITMFLLSRTELKDQPPGGLNPPQAPERALGAGLRFRL
jgi:hypothetical protein